MVDDMVLLIGKLWAYIAMFGVRGRLTLAMNHCEVDSEYSVISHGVSTYRTYIQE